MSQSMIRLTPDFWLAQSELYATNSGIWLSQGQACLVDPGLLPVEIEAIVTFLAEQEAEPQTIILTHSHWDHLLGPARLTGAEVIAQANYVDQVSGEKGRRLQRQIADWEAGLDIAREGPFVAPQPDTLFEDTLDVNVGKHVLELRHAPGHSPDQLVIYWPDEALLWAADMLSDLEIPYVIHNLAAYERTLAMLSTWEVGTLIPGHGQFTSASGEIRTRIAQDRVYLKALRERVTQAVGQGQSVAETVASCADMRYRYPDENAGPHRLNVETVYLELGGEADPTQVGWGKLASETS